MQVYGTHVSKCFNRTATFERSVIEGEVLIDFTAQNLALSLRKDSEHLVACLTRKIHVKFKLVTKPSR